MSPPPTSGPRDPNDPNEPADPSEPPASSAGDGDREPPASSPRPRKPRTPARKQSAKPASPPSADPVASEGDPDATGDEPLDNDAAMAAIIEAASRPNHAPIYDIPDEEPLVPEISDGIVARDHLRGLLEALLFVSVNPIPLGDLARTAQAEKREVKEILDELRGFYHLRGMRLEEVAGGWVFRTNPAYAPFVRDVTDQKPVRLTRAQIETLAIVAYRQPITRPEIDDIRGTDSGPMLKALLERNLVKMLGKREEPGRPILYGTSPYFLEFFGLRSLRDLPTLREFTELTDESRRTYERKIGEAPEVVLSTANPPPAEPVTASTPASATESVSAADLGVVEHVDVTSTDDVTTTVIEQPSVHPDTEMNARDSEHSPAPPASLDEPETPGEVDESQVADDPHEARDEETRRDVAEHAEPSDPADAATTIDDVDRSRETFERDNDNNDNNDSGNDNTQSDERRDTDELDIDLANAADSLPDDTDDVTDIRTLPKVQERDERDERDEDDDTTDDARDERAPDEARPSERTQVEASNGETSFTPPPSEPSEPSEPREPREPSEPSEPIEPSEPSEPIASDTDLQKSAPEAPSAHADADDASTSTHEVSSDENASHNDNDDNDASHAGDIGDPSGTRIDAPNDDHGDDDGERT